MEEYEKISSDYYKAYVGSYAKRFYTPFEKSNIAKIIGFRLKEIENVKGEISKIVYFKVEQYSESYGKKYEWEWDVEDCVIIVDKEIEDNRIVSINHPEYSGYNPYTE